MQVNAFHLDEELSKSCYESYLLTHAYLKFVGSALYLREDQLNYCNFILTVVCLTCSVYYAATVASFTSGCAAIVTVSKIH